MADELGSLETYEIKDVSALVQMQADKVEKAMRKDPFYAELIAAMLTDALVPVTGNFEYDALSAAMKLAFVPAVRSMMDMYAELSFNVGVSVAGIWGIFDPSPFVDGGTALIQLGMAAKWGKSYAFDALLSAISMVPYLGDAAAKWAVLGRVGNRIAKLKGAIEALELQTRILGPNAAGVMRRLIQRAEAAVHSEHGAAMVHGTHLTGYRRFVKSFSGEAAEKKLWDAISALPSDAPYRKMETLARYMRKRGVEVAWGDKGAKVLDALGAKEGMGLFLVDKATGRTALVWRGEPSKINVHHELWHRVDYLKNKEVYKKGTTLQHEQYVHDRLTASRRWNDGSYGTKGKVNQELYIEKVKQDSLLEEVAALLGKK